jgi:hypothetical protein
VQFERVPIFTPRPSLDEVLTVRRERQATVHHVMASLTDEQLASEVTRIELLLSGYDTPPRTIRPDS